MRRLWATIAFCLFLLALPIGLSASAQLKQVLARDERLPTVTFGIPNASGILDTLDLPTRKAISPTTRPTTRPSPTLTEHQVGVTVYLEDGIKSAIPLISAEVYVRNHYSGFGSDPKGRLTIRKATGEQVLSGSIVWGGSAVMCNPIPGSPGYPYYATEDTFRLEITEPGTRLEEYEHVYVDLSIEHEDGSLFERSGIEAIVVPK